MPINFYVRNNCEWESDGIEKLVCLKCKGNNYAWSFHDVNFCNCCGVRFEGCISADYAREIRPKYYLGRTPQPYYQIQRKCLMFEGDEWSNCSMGYAYTREEALAKLRDEVERETGTCWKMTYRLIRVDPDKSIKELIQKVVNEQDIP